MLRIIEDRVGLSLLDDIAVINHRYTIGNCAHDTEIVTDEKIGKAELFLQIHHQIENLRLNGDIKS
ncbi:hypothetical protein D3C80_1982850 [compost metagenome]